MRNRQGYNKNHEKREEHDYYATPPEEVENILKYEKLYGTILDNSCGEGHLIEPVKRQYHGNNIIATDLVDRGYGEGGLNFLHPNYPYTDIDTIIMNPPYKLIREFVVKALKIAKKKVVLFAQLQFLESQNRYNNIFKNNKPERIYIYVDRIACAINGNFEEAHDSSMTYSWIIWDKINTEHKFEWIRRAEEKNKQNKLF
jgi:hypothetical protein